MRKPQSAGDDGSEVCAWCAHVHRHAPLHARTKAHARTYTYTHTKEISIMESMAAMAIKHDHAWLNKPPTRVLPGYQERESVVYWERECARERERVCAYPSGLHQYTCSIIII